MSVAEALEKHYSPEEVAKMWSVHKDTIRKMFRDEPGVVSISNGKLKKNRTIRIPAAVLERVHRRMANV
jgi:hypothetical protein